MVACQSASLIDRLPAVRGQLIAGEPLSGLTWFRVGGPAEVLFKPADADDLAAFLAGCPRDIPVTVIGVVVRLGKAFMSIETLAGNRVRAGAAALDVAVARAAMEASIAGLEFYRGIPGSIGGALRMNAGAYGRETCDVLIEAVGIDREGRYRVFSAADMGFSYRHSAVPDDIIFVEALFQGAAGERAEIERRMSEITESREASQPIRSRTGGSTFKNPQGGKAWQLIDQAGCRGLVVGDAQVSEQHCNFLINRGQASAADLETLGEEVRRRVREMSGVDLHWEIKRIGEVRS